MFGVEAAQEPTKLKAQALPPLRKPRWTDEAEIISRIDKLKAKAMLCEKESWGLDREAQELLFESARVKDAAECGELVVRSKECKTKAIKIRRTAELILDKHLPELKNKLTTFRTPQIPVIDNGDTSIPK